jgi:hypothetical protein
MNRDRKIKGAIDVMDRETVMLWLGICGKDDDCSAICPYKLRGPDCMCQLMADALALLKWQEPILLENQHKPCGISTNANSPWISRCPKCGKKVEGKQTKFCKHCGQAVKWE